MIYHGHLTILWEKTTIAYLKDKGYYDRFIKLTGTNNDKVGNVYKNCVPGDSPEHCRGLDSHGFADLEVSIAFHVALTSNLPRKDPRKFQLGTPKEVFRCMERCWVVEPTSERVAQDISGWEQIIDKLIESKGCVVQGESLRSGRRARRADGDTDVATRVRNFQRKGTKSNRPVHPDAQECYEQLMNGTLDSETFADQALEVIAGFEADDLIRETSLELRAITERLTRDGEVVDNPHDDDDDAEQIEGGDDGGMQMDGDAGQIEGGDDGGMQIDS